MSALATTVCASACAPDVLFTLEVWVNESTFALSVDRGRIESGGATFLRVFADWESYDDALAHPGLTLSNDASTFTLEVRDCGELAQNGELGVIVHQVQSASVADDGTISLQRTAGWECTDTQDRTVGTVP